MADQTSARAVIRISALPDSNLRRSLTGTVDASRKASNDVAKNQAKANKEIARDTAALEKFKQSAAEKGAKLQIRLEAMKRKEAALTAKQAAADATKSAAQSAKVEQQKVKLQIASAKLQQRIVDGQVREQERADAAKGKSAEKLEKYRIALMRNSAAMQNRESEKSARGQIRDAQKANREQQAVARQRKDGLMRAGALLVGAGAAAYGRAQSYAGTYGAKSTEELASNAIQFQRRSALVSDMAGLSGDDKNAMQQKLLATSARTGIDASDLLGGLETAQDRFSDLKGFTKIIDDLADVSLATGTSVESVVGAMGVMRRQFSLTDDEMKDLGGAMVQAADLGNISFQDVADNFASALGAMGRNANLHGMAGAKQALGITQLLGTSDMSSSEAATLGVRVVSSLNDVKVQKALKKSFGVNVTADGKPGTALRGMPDIFKDLVAKGIMDPNKGALRQKIFTEERGQRGVEVLATAFKNDPASAEKLLNLDPATGQASIKRRVSAMGEGAAGKAATLGARQFEKFMNGEGMQEFLDITVKAADSLTMLEAEYPRQAEALGITTGALKGFGAMLIAQTLFGRRGVGGGGLPTGGVPGTGGVSAPKAGGVPDSFVGWLGTAGTAIGVFTAAFETTTGILRAFNITEKDQQGLGSDLYAATHAEEPFKSDPKTDKERLLAKAKRRDHERAQLANSPLNNETADKLKNVDVSASLRVVVSDDRVRVQGLRSDGGFDVMTSVDNGTAPAL